MNDNEIDVSIPFLELVTALIETASSEKIDFFMIGATARDLVYAKFNINPGRATRDVDFGIRVSSWKNFDKLKKQLITKVQSIISLKDLSLNSVSTFLG